MKALSRSFLVLGACVGAFGCLGAPAVSEHVDSLDVVTDDDGPEREALADELWCPACITEGLRARSLSHDVRFHTSGRTDTVIVEIDGVLACAGRAVETTERLLVEVEGEGGEDEGNPDPEPALDGQLLPSPVPDPGGEMKSEDEGNPDPEPALDQPLPGPDPRHM